MVFLEGSATSFPLQIVWPALPMVSPSQMVAIPSSSYSGQKARSRPTLSWPGSPSGSLCAVQSSLSSPPPLQAPTSSWLDASGSELPNGSSCSAGPDTAASDLVPAEATLGHSSAQALLCLGARSRLWKQQSLSLRVWPCAAALSPSPAFSPQPESCAFLREPCTQPSNACNAPPPHYLANLLEFQGHITFCAPYLKSPHCYPCACTPFLLYVPPTTHAVWCSVYFY